MNPYTDPVGFIAAKDQMRAALDEWRNSLDAADRELYALIRRQQLIDQGATVRPDGRLEITVAIAQ